MIGEFSAVATEEMGIVADERSLAENGQPSDKGRGYVFDDPIIRVVDVAIALGRPLLVSGDPGCGKTTLAHAIARRLDIPRLHLFSVKSSSDACELFYSYDAIRRFREAQGKEGRPVGDYIEFQALGRAILDAHPREKIAHLLLGEANARYRLKNDPGPRRSVVLIDEIDKAPADFANDLLHEIEGLRFRVKELPGLDGREPETPPGDEISRNHRPIVVITSNEERQLPDAFLRRCVFLDLPFPHTDRLTKIINTGLRYRLEQMLGKGVELPVLEAERAKRLVTFFERFRDLKPLKKPGVAEVMDGAALMALAPDAKPDIVGPAMVKTRPDASLIEKAAERA